MIFFFFPFLWSAPSCSTDFGFCEFSPRHPDSAHIPFRSSLACFEIVYLFFSPFLIVYA